LKHDQAHALLDLLGHKGQQRRGVRAHAAVAVAVTVREREASGEQREEEGAKAAHDAGLQRADGRRRFSGQSAAAAETGEPSAVANRGRCMMMIKFRKPKAVPVVRCGGGGAPVFL
jgi:hypothetical protein